MTVFVRAALLALMATLTLACGNKELDPDGFVAAASATCRNANEQLGLIPSPTAVPGGDQDALANYLERALEVNEQAADNILALPIPASLQEDRRALVDAMTDANEGLEQAVEAADATDQTALAEAITKMAEGQRRFRQIAERLGIDGCVSGGVGPPAG